MINIEKLDEVEKLNKVLSFLIIIIKEKLYWMRLRGVN